jgi:hypothetical protein
MTNTLHYSIELDLLKAPQADQQLLKADQLKELLISLSRKFTASNLDSWKIILQSGFREVTGKQSVQNVIVHKSLNT